ncbi:hypothetical protein SAMN05421780_11047 [Flexibacter flexilis DSM 6793]|uniref:Uncharacterized protein n=1 Tax=Flexibacter flexilis DSM 6793 TaxID=927664 RepID=A0A1I1M7Z0_9BACT|nr:hypothetical protein [Flexibacter flexilis]SFC80882.1 hypothetical protein SAMN05421780_11047 [Flexibacter flexilis DSM 6793]
MTKVRVVSIVVNKSGQHSNTVYQVPRNVDKVEQMAVVARGLGEIMQVNRIYYGVAPDGESGESFILTLANQRVESFKNKVLFSAGAGQHCYYAQPASFGTPQFVYNGLTGGFLLVGTETVTDALTGYAQDYNLYKSLNPNLGNIAVNVSQL